MRMKVKVNILKIRLMASAITCEFGVKQPTEESDIFARIFVAGSVFFYFLRKECHLFGDKFTKLWDEESSC